VSLKDPVPAVEAVLSPDASAVRDDRRRPHRSKHASPHLIPLLRRVSPANSPAPLLENEDADSVDDDLATARGFGVGLLLAVPVWAIIGGVIWLMLH